MHQTVTLQLFTNLTSSTETSHYTAALFHKGLNYLEDNLVSLIFWFKNNNLTLVSLTENKHF